MKHVEREWEEYRRHVLPSNVSTVQLTETRRAFYAGAYLLLSSLTEILGEEQEPTPEDIAKLDAINNELKEFFAKVGTGGR
jgi:hypothetical protein